MRDVLAALVVAAGLAGIGAATAALVDTGFGSTGTGQVALAHQVRSLAKDSSGRYYAVGSPSFRALDITRFDAAGAIDTSYGNAGTVSTFLGRAAATAFAAAVDSADRLVVVGAGGADGYAARFLRSGELDATFGSGGVASIPDFTGFSSSGVIGVGIDALDRTLVLQIGVNTPPATFAQALRVVRLGTDGVLDSTYGSAGAAPVAPVDREPAGIVVDAAGRATVSGGISTARSSVVVVRLDPDGAPDGTFGTDGVSTIPIPGIDTLTAGGIDLDPSGRTVVAGSVNRFGTTNGLVVRLGTTGTLDTGFSNDGVQLFDDGQFASPAFIGVEAGTDGIALAGYTNFFSSLPAWYAGRLKNDGSFDETFGGAGRYVSKLSTSFAYAMSSSDGVVAGSTTTSTGFLTRLVGSTTDITKPTLTLPSGLVVEATSAAGAQVPFIGLSATDAGDPSPELACSRQSGSQFPIGTITIACRATDASGNAATGTFQAQVADRTAPALTVPDDIILDATGPVPVQFAASAIDVVDGIVQPVCSPTSGSLFPLGRTDVTCTATDKAGNSASATFAVAVRIIDEQAPQLTLPTALSADAIAPNGVVVTYAATATDAVDGPTAVNCAPATGALFAIGDTTVTCSSTDRAGNTAQGSFKVHVRGAEEQMTALRQLTIDPRLARQLAKLTSPLTGDRQTCAELGRFADAARRASFPDLALRADRIAAVLGC